MYLRTYVATAVPTTVISLALSKSPLERDWRKESRKITFQDRTKVCAWKGFWGNLTFLPFQEPFSGSSPSGRTFFFFLKTWKLLLFISRPSSTERRPGNWPGNWSRRTGTPSFFPGGSVLGPVTRRKSRDETRSRRSRLVSSRLFSRRDRLDLVTGPSQHRKIFRPQKRYFQASTWSGHAHAPP